MNERIRELALQAGHKPLGTFSDELMDIYNKKFAELIVKECAYTARQCYTVRGADAEEVAQHIEKTLL